MATTLIAKLLPVKYNKYFNHAYNNLNPNDNVIDIYDKDVVKKMVEELLFIDKHDYVLINYLNKMYVCERDDDNNEFNRREITYHPLQNKIKI